MGLVCWIVDRLRSSQRGRVPPIVAHREYSCIGELLKHANALRPLRASAIKRWRVSRPDAGANSVAAAALVSALSTTEFIGTSPALKDARDRDPVDPRDVFVNQLDLPRGHERELSVTVTVSTALLMLAIAAQLPEWKNIADVQRYCDDIQWGRTRATKRSWRRDYAGCRLVRFSPDRALTPGCELGLNAVW